jgi:hypothetical protein
MRHFLMSAIAVGGAMVVASCGPYVGSESSTPALESQENLVYLDLAVREQIPCEKLDAQKQPSGRTLVCARFMNQQNHTAECQIKVKFRNSAGRVVDESSWMPLLLPRREVTQFEHLSLATDVESFTVLVRAAKKP